MRRWPFCFIGMWEDAMQNSDAAETVASADYVVGLLPANADEAEATLALIEHALAHPGSQPGGCTGPTSYAFNHLRKRTPEAAAAIIAAVRDIIRPA
jgi:hypothetical protein